MPRPEAYDRLVETGFVGSLKRDVLLEASRDLEYVGAIRFAFIEAGAEAAKCPDECAVELIRELTLKGLCSLATWAAGYGSAPRLLDATKSDVSDMVATSQKPGGPFTYFLLSTDAGDDWVRRYETLVGELQ